MIVHVGTSRNFSYGGSRVEQAPGQRGNGVRSHSSVGVVSRLCLVAKECCPVSNSYANFD